MSLDSTEGSALFLVFRLCFLYTNKAEPPNEGSAL
jgi:hypothetical protein